MNFTTVIALQKCYGSEQENFPKKLEEKVQIAPPTHYKQFQFTNTNHYFHLKSKIHHYTRQ